MSLRQVFLSGIGGAMKTSKQIVKLVAFGVALTCLFACAVGVLVACNEEIEPHDVEIVLINPHTGEPMSIAREYLTEPPAGTPIEVKIKDLVTGEYLTDEDLPETTIADSLSIGIVRYLDWDYNGSARVQNYHNTWPNREEIGTYYTIYKIAIGFDCRPRNPENPREFQRKYKMRSASFMFEYI